MTNCVQPRLNGRYWLTFCIWIPRFPRVETQRQSPVLGFTQNKRGNEANFGPHRRFIIVGTLAFGVDLILRHRPYAIKALWNCIRVVERERRLIREHRNPTGCGKIRGGVNGVIVPRRSGDGKLNLVVRYYG